MEKNLSISMGVLALCMAVFADDSFAYGFYFGGSVSPGMMKSKMNWEGTAKKDPNRYNIDCSIISADAGICEDTNTDTILDNVIWGEGSPETWASNASKGIFFSIAAGYTLMRSPLRFEVEYVSLSNKLQFMSAHIDSSATLIDFNKFDLELGIEAQDRQSLSGFMANGYFSFPVPVVDPYIGVGLGYLSGSTDYNEKNGVPKFATDSGFGYQYMIGAEYRIPNTGFIFGLEYRSISLSDVPVNNEGNGSISANGFLVKFRYDPIEETLTQKKKKALKNSRYSGKNNRKYQDYGYY